MVASSGIQDARFVLFGTRQLDIPASQSWCLLRESNAVPFTSNTITLST
ncbi:unnamed protein product [Schistosoma curassoni]|uniref:Uncharacterized protein n=1 Tax=Schistosoma curassoni TaxID=6186 RepID=A0A183KA47_9TREM|nr:unnamed protein product [Schistosoma curassoni]